MTCLPVRGRLAHQRPLRNPPPLETLCLSGSAAGYPHFPVTLSDAEGSGRCRVTRGRFFAALRMTFADVMHIDRRWERGFLQWFLPPVLNGVRWSSQYLQTWPVL